MKKREKGRFVFALTLLCFCMLAASASVPATVADGINITEEWNMTFGGASDDYGYSVQQTADGGYILAGDTRSYGAGDADIWLIKTDREGNEQWSRTFGGTKADLLDRGSVRQTSDGGYAITGYTYSYGAGDADVWLIKTDMNGNEVWNRTFGGAYPDWGHSVRQTSDEGYIIAGRTDPSAGTRADAWLIKTDSKGAEEWNRTFGTAACEHAASVQQTADGGYIMTGRTTSFGAIGGADAWLIRTDSDGIEEWNRTFGGAGYDYGYSVQQTSDGGYAIAGSTNGRDDVWLIKTDSNGTEEWNTIFGGPAKDEGYSVQQTSDGGYVAAGYTESYGTAGSADVWLIRTDSDGIEQWNMTVGGAGLEKGYSVQQTSDGGYIVTGYTNSYGAGGYDLWLIKLSTPIVRQIDLLPTALETAPTLYDNFTNTIGATIKNNGTGDAPSLFNVSLSADGSPVDMTEVSGLDAGKSVVVSLSWTPSRTGDFELCVMADCDSNVNESEEGNNVLCKNVTVLSFEHPCWNDSFDDETKIAGMQNVIVHEGDVKHEQKSHGGWESDSSLESGLGSYGTGNPPGPAMAYNITGDGRWNLILGGSYGYYWNGTQWISDSSLVAGLEGIGYDLAPAIAYNITGDGKWNLIVGRCDDAYGHGCRFYGFYWNGTQWMRDDSLVSGLVAPAYPLPAIAFNITGDGRWDLIIGEKYGGFYGYCWNGTQWISDSSLVAGLGDVGRSSAPAIAFNITGDGRWNLIAGKRYGVCGYYWNGTQWVSDSSVSFGLSLESYYTKLAMGFNITGDGSWNLIGSKYDGHYYVFKGFRYWGGYIDTGSVKSVAIQPSLAYFKNWAVFNANDTVPAGTNVTYKILDASSSTIMTVVSGQNISGITQTSIRLYAELTTTNISYTPVLHDWDVCWETGDVDLLPTAIETPAELYANVTTIGAVIANEGDVHSGSVEFNVTLYANEVEVDSKRIVVDDMAPGWSTSVMFYGWTPPHAGTYNLTVIVDSEDEIVESNEGNNELRKEVTVLPSTMRRLTFDPNSSVSPDVATDSEGNLHLVWYDDLGEGTGLYYKKLAPNGMVLVDDKRVCQGSGPKIAVDSSGEVHVVINTDSLNLSYLKLDNNGDIVVEPKQVMSGIFCPGCSYWYPAKAGGIAVDRSGNVHMVVCMPCAGLLIETGRLMYCNQEMRYVKLDNNGNELVNYTIEHITVSLYGTWNSIGAPGIAVDSEGTAYVAYEKGLGACAGSGCAGFTCCWPTCAKVWYAKIDDEGVHKQELTGDLPLPSLYPSVCVDSGDNKYVIWSQHNGSGSGGTDCLKGGGFDFYLTKFDKSGNKVMDVDGKRLTYEDYLQESYFSGGCYLPSVARPIIDTESGVIHVTWSRESEKEIYYMAFDTSGGEMTNKTLISFEDGDSWEPDIDACKDGAHLVWADNRDENNEIYYAKVLLPLNRVFIMCPSDKWTLQNVTATYAIGIMHTMPGSETFNLTRDNLDSADVAELNKSTITLAPSSIGEVILNVTDAVLGDYRVKVSVESQSNPEIMAECTVTTSVIKQKPDLIITAIDAYHNNTAESPWFNLSNEVDVEVKNTGTADAGAFNVSLYADTEYIDKKRVSDLEAGSSTILQLKWAPVGEDCFKDCTFTDTSHEYNLTAIADCDNDMNESDETNNNLTEVEKACYNGYMADEPLENVFHGTLRGGLLFTTGDGTYGGLYEPGDYRNTTYEITLPPGASVVLARLNVYYTWHYEKDSCPAMGVSITNASGTYVVPLDRDYNDIKCYCPGAAWVFPWGNYVYNLTDHIQSNGTYTVTVKRAVFPPNPSFCIAAPGIEVLYEDETKPLIEYWINEGADVLIGGRRGDGGHLSLEECINNATFPGNVDAGKVEKATLGVVSPWAGAGWTPGMTNYLFFNDVVLGRGVYHGYSEKYKQTIDGITMEINSTNAQVGVNLSDVTDYLQASDNRVGQGDDGDNMMPSNAFLVVEYKEIEVDKTVWDAANESWVKELGANVSDTLGFRCLIHNVKTSDLTNITVVDVLPDILEYKNNATVNGVPHEPVQAGNEYEWNFTRLEPCENITIEFDAGVVKCGNCTNTLRATAWCEGTGEMVFGDDRVSVTVQCVIPTPFLIYGDVNYSTGSPVLNPDVRITNLNTSEVFIAETNASSNYYQVLTTSENVSAGDILHFRASNGNITEFNHTVTEEEMNNGGFEQDIVITVEDITPPGSITNLTNITGNFWINWTWNNPADADFNYTIVYINGTFETNTSKKYYNLTNLSPHSTRTISTHTVDTSGNVNETRVNQTATIQNNVPVLESIGDKTVDEGQTVTIAVNASDLDGDTLTYSCNRTDLFADFNTTTGIGNWTPSAGQAGTYYADFDAADGFGGMDNETIKIIVLDKTPPASITNLTNTTGNFWINWTWDNPVDDDFNYTMVYIDGAWETNTSIEYFNLTNLSPHSTRTISTHTVDTSGNVNETWVNQTTMIPNNVPVLEHIGDKAVDEGQTLAVDVNATDLDDDTLTYSCNRTDLFADFNRTTGIGSWTPSPGQAGTYYVDFGVADGFGGIDNETIRIIILDKTPPASISNLSYTNGTTWINWTWTNPADADFNYTLLYLNGTWQTNTSYPFYNATALDQDTCYGVGTHTVDKVGNVNQTWVNQTAKTQAEILEKLVFDTGEGTSPSIFGTHRGKIIPDKDIVVHKMYTYPCTGTGGHAEYVKIWNSTLNVSASGNGYKGDWHNISFSKSFILKADETYYYEIITGSYPQIIHASSKEVTGGTITCDKFIDANGRIYNDWIPAIKFFW